MKSSNCLPPGDSEPPYRSPLHCSMMALVSHCNNPRSPPGQSWSLLAPTSSLTALFIAQKYWTFPVGHSVTLSLCHSVMVELSKLRGVGRHERKWVAVPHHTVAWSPQTKRGIFCMAFTYERYIHITSFIYTAQVYTSKSSSTTFWTRKFLLCLYCA